MQISKHNGSKFRLQKKALGVHLNKVQALICVAGTAALSTGLVLFGAKAFI